MLLAAIALLSAAALGYEILLLRLFSIAQWHHFAYMVISLALLGYGASGTLLSWTRRRWLRHLRGTFALGAVVFALTSVTTFAWVQRLPFNVLELLWDPRQVGVLAVCYLLLSVPFLAAATALGLALTAFGERAALVYRADLLGAGAGALGVVAALTLAPAELCLRWISGIALLAAALAIFGSGARRRASAAVLAAAVALLPIAWPAGWVEPRLSPFKGLSQTLRLPGSRVLEERSHPLGRLTVVTSPEVPLRHAPGLSLACTEEPPEQLGIFVDGEGPTVIDRWNGSAPYPTYLDFLPSALPYHLLDRPRVLILGAGGGSEVLGALAHGASRVDAVEIHPQILELVAGPFDAYAGGLYRRGEVHTHAAEARAFVAERRERWDLIQISLLDSYSSAAAGTGALAESYLYTVEAFELLLQRLEPGGLLAVTRWLRLPPRDSLKLFATAVEALERLRVPRPADRLAMIRSWSTVTLLVAAGELEAPRIEALRAFADRRSFDLAYYPGMPAAEANRYNLLDAPLLFQGAQALLDRQRRDFLADYKFYITPATDDRPYFFRFFKWRTLPELLALRGRGGTPLVESSYLVLLATLVQAGAAAVLLILLPLGVLRRRRGSRLSAGRVGLYFFTLGLAFLFLEIAFLQRLTLLLGHPVYAASVVLGAFLVFAGLGSGFSRALSDPDSRIGDLLRRWGRASPARAAAAALAAWTLVYLLVLPSLFQALLGAPLALRATFALAVVAPLAFLMGMPFPLGLGRLASHTPDWVPWAWGINGCASVMSPILATLLAIHLGFTGVVALAAGLYGLAAWAADGV